MPQSPLITITALAIFLAALVAYWFFVKAVVDAFGIPSAIVLIALCYALALRIHRRECGY